MAARLRASRLLALLAVVAAASLAAAAPASAQSAPPCTESWVETDLYSDGAYEWSFNGEVYDQTKYRTLDLSRDVPFTLSVAGDLGNGRTFTGWTGQGVSFSDSSSATATVTVHGTADTLNGGCDAVISAHYSAPVPAADSAPAQADTAQADTDSAPASSGYDWSWLWSWWPF